MIGLLSTVRWWLLFRGFAGMSSDELFDEFRIYLCIWFAAWYGVAPIVTEVFLFVVRLANEV